ncbi:MAG TPA: spore coat U domain-containing protein [Gammaproteobacteria bacterium]|nr:spore coat U domain-containing protein [Gammaproteobacteria bacterium]
MNKRLLSLVIAGAFMVSTASALAATATASLNATATVVDACEVSAAALTFGDVNPLSATAVKSSADITVTCSNGTGYDIGLSVGSGTGATVATRIMTGGANGSDTLNYKLYSDDAYSVAWGDTAATGTVSGTGTGTAQTHIVYGLVPAGQTAATLGDYSDTVTVTVTY